MQNNLFARVQICLPSGSLMQGNPKTLTPGPRTPTTDRSAVYLRTAKRTTTTDPSTDHPQNRIKIKDKDFNYCLSSRALVCAKFTLGKCNIPINRPVNSLVNRPGARFSKLPVITGPVKLFCFPFQMGVSKLLKIIQLSFQLKKQSGLH